MTERHFGHRATAVSNAAGATARLSAAAISLSPLGATSTTLNNSSMPIKRTNSERRVKGIGSVNQQRVSSTTRSQNQPDQGRPSRGDFGDRGRVVSAAGPVHPPRYRPHVKAILAVGRRSSGPAAPLSHESRSGRCRRTGQNGRVASFIIQDGHRGQENLPHQNSVARENGVGVT